MLKKREDFGAKKMRKSSSFQVLPLAIASLLLASTAAKAGSLSINLSAPYQTGSESVFAFVATVTNTSGSTVYLNADTFSVNAPLVLDDGPFLSGYPLSLSAAGPGSTYTGLLFNVDIPSGTLYGLYEGSFAILGSGNPADDSTVAGSAVFNVFLTPEPSSLILLPAGLAFLGGILRRRGLAT